MSARKEIKTTNPIKLTFLYKGTDTVKFNELSLNFTLISF
jgi:hypothetical protein